LRKFAVKLALPAFAAALAAVALTSIGASAATSAPDAARGKRLFATCAACHSTSAASPPRMGPHLQGVVGRKAASVAGFRYSPALAKANIVWTEAKLDAWLTRPQALVPGSAMPYAGMADPADRKAVIAYLRKPVP
jgi:cytochrome c